MVSKTIPFYVKEHFEYYNFSLIKQYWLPNDKEHMLDTLSRYLSLIKIWIDNISVEISQPDIKGNWFINNENDELYDKLVSHYNYYVLVIESGDVNEFIKIKKNIKQITGKYPRFHIFNNKSSGIYRKSKKHIKKAQQFLNDNKMIIINGGWNGKYKI